MCGNVSKSRFIFYLSPIKLLSDLPHYAKMYHTGAYQVNTKFFKIKGKKLLDSTSHMLGNSDKSELRIARGILQMRTKGDLSPEKCATCNLSVGHNINTQNREAKYEEEQVFGRADNRHLKGG